MLQQVASTYKERCLVRARDLGDRCRSTDSELGRALGDAGG